MGELESLNKMIRDLQEGHASLQGTSVILIGDVFWMRVKSDRHEVCSRLGDFERAEARVKELLRYYVAEVRFKFPPLFAGVPGVGFVGKIVGIEEDTMMFDVEDGSSGARSLLLPGSV